MSRDFMIVDKGGLHLQGASEGQEWGVGRSEGSSDGRLYGGIVTTIAA